jgi:hypothetical protein
MKTEKQDVVPIVLSFEIGEAICSELLPLAERAEEHAAKLRADGFEAFLSAREWREGFCSCEHDKELHRMLEVEQAKHMIYAQALPLPWITRPLSVIKEHYISPLVRRLEEERDLLNGMPPSELSKRFSGPEAWIRRQIDPCERNLAIAHSVDREKIEADRARVLDRVWERFQREVATNATEMGTNSQASLASRIGLFIAAAQKYLGPSGFSFERNKSRPKHPAVVKPIGFGWELRWLISDVTTFDYEQPHPSRDGWPKFDPWLVLCHTSLGSDLGGKGRGNFLRINYAAIIREFFGVYRTFFTGPELEVLIKVHACFLDLILGDIKNGINKIMSKP